MPTDRFYRLPEEKKQIIREAAIKEFARVPFEKASINQIIQNADISRGSFYTYFADKHDVVGFIFEDIQEQMKRQCEISLEANGGDYFKMLRDIFEVFVAGLQQAKNMMDMVRNVLSYQENANAMGFGSAQDALCDGECDPNLMWLFDKVDTTHWRSKKLEDFGPLMTLGMASLMIALSQYYKCPEKLDQVRIWYDKKLEILRWGVMTENNNNESENKRREQ